MRSVEVLCDPQLYLVAACRHQYCGILYTPVVHFPYKIITINALKTVAKHSANLAERFDSYLVEKSDVRKNFMQTACLVLKMHAFTSARGMYNGAIWKCLMTSKHGCC